MNLNTQFSGFKLPIRIVAIFILIIGVVACFWMVNTKVPEIETETNNYIAQNQTLATKEENLVKLKNNMEHYLGETERLIAETDDMLTEYPTFMYLEDKILYADTLLKTDLKGYNLANFIYGQSEYVMSVSYGSDNTEKHLLELYEVVLKSSFQDLTYAQVKEILDYALVAPQRFVVNSMEMMYTERSGYLMGEFSFKTFFIPGQPTPYEFPQHVVDGLGNSNRIDDLFGARTNPVDNTNN